MPGLKIPKEYEQGIVVVKSLSDSDVHQILEVLKGENQTIDPPALVSAVLPILSQRSRNEVRNFAEALHSLYFLRAHSDVEIEKFVDDLIDAVRLSDNKQLQTSDPEELVHLRNTFKSLLTVRRLSLQLKADELGEDFANIFWDAKIITDIRPIWEGDVKRPPEGTVITNTLKLEYHSAGGHGELYLYIDKDDIDTLLSVLNRSKDKMTTLESLATASWMKILRE